MWIWFKLRHAKENILNYGGLAKWRKPMALINGFASSWEGSWVMPLLWFYLWESCTSYKEVSNPKAEIFWSQWLESIGLFLIPKKKPDTKNSQFLLVLTDLFFSSISNVASNKQLKAKSFINYYSKSISTILIHWSQISWILFAWGGQKNQFKKT
jgi:hypothetical protein